MCMRDSGSQGAAALRPPVHPPARERERRGACTHPRRDRAHPREFDARARRRPPRALLFETTVTRLLCGMVGAPYLERGAIGRRLVVSRLGRPGPRSVRACARPFRPRQCLQWAIQALAGLHCGPLDPRLRLALEPVRACPGPWPCACRHGLRTRLKSLARSLPTHRFWPGQCLQPGHQPTGTRPKGPGPYKPTPP